MEIYKSTLDRIIHTLRPSNIPVFILVTGALVRLIGYSSSAIRYDEALSLYRATLPVFQYLSNLESYSSLILWEIMLRLISKIGTSLWIIRLPAISIGLLSLVVVWKLMDRFGFSKIQKLVSASIIAFCPGLIWISQDGRAYGLLVLLYLLSIYFIHKRRWLGFVATNGLLLYTHIISPAFIIGSFIYGIALYPKEWKRFLIFTMIIIMSWLPWGLLNLLQAINPQDSPQFINTFWLGDLTLISLIWQSILAYFVRIVNYPLSILFIVSIILSIIILITNSISKPNINVLFFFTPFCVILLESIFWKNTLFYRTIITLIIPFTISLVAIIFNSKRKLLDWIMIALWIFITLVGVAGWNPRLRGGDVDVTAQEIRNNWQDGDVIYYATGTTALPFNYYLDDKPEYLLNGVANSNLTPTTLQKFEFIALEKLNFKRAWVVYPEDIFLPPDQMKRLQIYVRDGELINRIKIFEIPDILVYLVDL